MSRKGASRLETEMQIWTRAMGIIPGRNSSEVFRKLCNNERKSVFERVMREIRPSHEVDHIRKNLALKRMSQKAEQRQMLAAKEEEIHMREHDFELAHQRLIVLNCELQAIKQRTRDLHTKKLILCYKRQDLEKDAVRYEELCEVANFFQEPKESGSGDVHSSYNKHTENCRNAVCECNAQIVELHKLYKMKDLDLEILHGRKKSVLEFVHCQMKDIPIMNIWHTLLHSIDCLNKELHSLTQRDLKESEHLQSVKECIDSEMKKFMKSHLELFAAHHSLQHKINSSNSECDTLLDRTAEMLQEKMLGRELSEDVQESGKVREWLELQIKFTDLDVIKSALQQEIKNLKANVNLSDSYILPLQEEEAKRISKEIERVQADIRTNYMWLTRSHAGQTETEEKLKQEITKLSKIFALDEHGVTTLDASVKGLQNAVEQELKEFMALPLHLLENVTLPLGSVIPSSQQILKYHHHHQYTGRELADVLTALEGAPSAAPHSIALQFLEKKLYLNFLNMAEMNTNDLKPSLAVLDISYMKNMDNAATTAVTEAVKLTEKSMEGCRVVAARAEDNYRAWLEHPLQHAVPEHLRIDEKHFEAWRCEYDNWLAALTDLESEEQVPQI